MKELTTYALEVLACSGALIAAYVILLEKRVAFRWCRAYLLLTTAIAAIIPLLSIPVWPGKVLTALPAATVGEWGPSPEVLPDDTSVTPEVICLAAYALGVVLVLALAGWQIVRIRRLRHTSAITRTAHFTLIRTQQRIASFSFLRSIYLWQGTPDAELPAIVAHEASHIRHRHSMERIAMECLKALLWWNPFAWIAARRLTEVEEFEADSDVLRSGYDTEIYMHVLLKQLFGYSPEIANCLRSSLTKKRFQMMTTKTPGRYALLRLAGTLPVMIGLLCAFAFTTRAAQIVYPGNEAAAAVQSDTHEVSVQVFKDKQPLAGALVQLAGTDKGVVTDTDGKARIAAVAGDVLDITYIGCERQRMEVPAGRNAAIAVTLPAAKDTPDEAVAATAEAPEAKPAAAREGRIRISVLLMDKNSKGFSSENVAAGAVVKVINSATGAVTDDKGIATLEAREGTVLEIHYPDYAPAAVVVTTQPEYFVLLRPNDMEKKSPMYSVDNDGVKQSPIYIVDGIEQPFSPEMNVGNIASITVLKDASTIALYGERARNGVVIITTKRAAKQTERQAAEEKAGVTARENGEEEAFLVSETMPRFQSGDLNTFRAWVQQQVRYPAEAMNKKLQGRVVITFVVEKNGAVSDLRFLASPDKLFSDEVRRIMTKVPEDSWTPGEQKGKPVRVKYTLPIDFRIPDDAKSAPAKPAAQPAPTQAADKAPAQASNKKEIAGEEIIVIGYGTSPR